MIVLKNENHYDLNYVKILKNFQNLKHYNVY